MGDSSVRSEDQNANRDEGSKDYAHAISDGNRNCIGNWTGDHSCHILAKNLSTFSLCHPKTLSEAELKGGRLTSLVEESL
jgi:hypothetical protein